MDLPVNFTDRIKKELGGEYDSFIISYDEKPLSGIRLNRLKISPDKWEKLSGVSLNKIPWIDNGYYYDANEWNASKSPFYYAGLFYIQEPSAQTPANVLPVEPGMRVLDLCAAPGGKSTELAAKLQGKGLLVSNDISATRAKALVKNLGVFGIKNALITSEEPGKLLEYFPGFFDRILVDAPCSGEGMFRREPAVMKNWEQYGTKYYNDIQKNIILKAADMLAPGGMMVYSTCTFSPDEDEGTLDYLLSERPEFSVIKIENNYEGFDNGHPEWINSGREEIRNAIRIWPHRMKGEGHFIALLKKADTRERFSSMTKTIPVKLMSDEKEFLLNNGIKEVELSRLELHVDKLYLIPEGLPDVTGLRILRNGLYIGDRKKGRFEPSEPFAMSLKREDIKYYLALPKDDERVIRYLKCETIDISDEEKKANGLDKAENGAYVIIGIEDYPLGWGKVSSNTIKNKYFSGWRMM